MPPKCEASTPNPSQLMNPKGSKPSSSLDNIEKLTSPLLATEPSSTSLHQGSATGSLTKPCLVGQRSLQSHDGAATSDQNSAFSFVGETDGQAEPQKCCRNFNSDMDPKKLKRLLANRVSAQKSRMKKQEYVEKLKQDINTKEAKVSGLAPQVAFYEVQRKMLEEENHAMKQRMEILEKKRAEKDAEYQKLKNERDMLALTYFLQQEGI